LIFRRDVARPLASTRLLSVTLHLPTCAGMAPSIRYHDHSRSPLQYLSWSSNRMLATAAILECIAAHHHSRVLTASSCECKQGFPIALCQRLSGGGADENAGKSAPVPCLFRIKVPYTMPGDMVKIAGGAETIGKWQKDKALSLTTSKDSFPWLEL
jgi:hypothetical protein